MSGRSDSMAEEVRETFPEHSYSPPEQEWPDYVVHLNFNSDGVGLAFREWWYGAGQETFAKWLEQFGDQV